MRNQLRRALKLFWGLVALGALGGAVFLVASLLPAAREIAPSLFARGGSTVALQVFAGLLLVVALLLWLSRGRIDAWVSCLEEELKLAAQQDLTGLEEDATSERLGQGILAVALLLALSAVGVAVFEPHAYFGLIDEDGLVEYSSAFLWMAAAVLMLVSTLALPPRSRAMLLAYLLLAAFFLVCGGEEISWGQRIFGRESGEFFERVNKQNETNLHNIGSISIFANLFFLFSVLFFLGLPWLARKSRGWKNWLLLQRGPWLSVWAQRVYLVGLAVFVTVGLRFMTLGFSPFSPRGWYNQMDDEIFEFFAALAFFAFAALDLAWRLRHRSPQLPGRTR